MNKNVEQSIDIHMYVYTQTHGHILHQSKNLMLIYMKIFLYIYEGNSVNKGKPLEKKAK